MGLNGLEDRVFDAVLFDMDGTLVDSTAAVYRAWAAWAVEHGVPLIPIALAYVVAHYFSYFVYLEQAQFTFLLSDPFGNGADPNESGQLRFVRATKSSTIFCG